jgi:hypothetical protein
MRDSFTYEFGHNTASRRADMLLPRLGHGTWKYYHSIYSFGSYPNSATAEVYNINTDKWDFVKGLPLQMRLWSAALYEDLIYIVDYKQSGIIRFNIDKQEYTIIDAKPPLANN